MSCAGDGAADGAAEAAPALPAPAVPSQTLTLRANDILNLN